MEVKKLTDAIGRLARTASNELRAGKPEEVTERLLEIRDLLCEEFGNPEQENEKEANAGNPDGPGKPTEQCPRCKLTTLHAEDVLNSLSRRDNQTYICNDCGDEEVGIDSGHRNADVRELRFVESLKKSNKQE